MMTAPAANYFTTAEPWEMRVRTLHDLRSGLRDIGTSPGTAQRTALRIVRDAANLLTNLLLEIIDDVRAVNFVRAERRTTFTTNVQIMVMRFRDANITPALPLPDVVTSLWRYVLYNVIEPLLRLFALPLDDLQLLETFVLQPVPKREPTPAPPPPPPEPRPERPASLLSTEDWRRLMAAGEWRTAARFRPPRVTFADERVAYEAVLRYANTYAGFHPSYAYIDIVHELFELRARLFRLIEFEFEPFCEVVLVSHVPALSENLRAWLLSANAHLLRYGVYVLECALLCMRGLTMAQLADWPAISLRAPRLERLLSSSVLPVITADQRAIVRLCLLLVVDYESGRTQAPIGDNLRIDLAQFLHVAWSENVRHETADERRSWFWLDLGWWLPAHIATSATKTAARRAWTDAAARQVLRVREEMWPSAGPLLWPRGFYADYLDGVLTNARPYAGITAVAVRSTFYNAVLGYLWQQTMPVHGVDVLAREHAAAARAVLDDDLVFEVVRNSVASVLRRTQRGTLKQAMAQTRPRLDEPSLFERLRRRRGGAGLITAESWVDYVIRTNHLAPINFETFGGAPTDTVRARMLATTAPTPLSLELFRLPETGEGTADWPQFFVHPLWHVWLWRRFLVKDLRSIGVNEPRVTPIERIPDTATARALESMLRGEENAEARLEFYRGAVSLALYARGDAALWEQQPRVWGVELERDVLDARRREERGRTARADAANAVEWQRRRDAIQTAARQRDYDVVLGTLTSVSDVADFPTFEMLIWAVSDVYGAELRDARELYEALTRLPPLWRVIVVRQSSALRETVMRRALGDVPYESPADAYHLMQMIALFDADDELLDGFGATDFAERLVRWSFDVLAEPRDERVRAAILWHWQVLAIVHWSSHNGTWWRLAQFRQAIATALTRPTTYDAYTRPLPQATITTFVRVALWWLPVSRELCNLATDATVISARIQMLTTAVRANVRVADARFAAAPSIMELDGELYELAAHGAAIQTLVESHQFCHSHDFDAAHFHRERGLFNLMFDLLLPPQTYYSSAEYAVLHVQLTTFADVAAYNAVILAVDARTAFSSDMWRGLYTSFEDTRHRVYIMMAVVLGSARYVNVPWSFFEDATVTREFAAALSLDDDLPHSLSNAFLAMWTLHIYAQQYLRDAAVRAMMMRRDGDDVELRQRLDTIVPPPLAYHADFSLFDRAKEWIVAFYRFTEEYPQWRFVEERQQRGDGSEVAV